VIWKFQVILVILKVLGIFWLFCFSFQESRLLSKDNFLRVTQ
jgi:hypothetical protein